MAPTPQDRRLHEYLYRLASSGEPVTPQDLLTVIDLANRLAVQRCERCRNLDREKKARDHQCGPGFCPDHDDPRIAALKKCRLDREKA